MATDASGNERRPPSFADLLRDGRPDWDAIDFDVLCSRCDYNLRTLTHPRCPECGLEFEWSAVFDCIARRSEILFDQSRGPQLLWNWARSFWRSLRPVRFWKSVSIHDPLRPAPLWLLVISGVAVFGVSAFLGRVAIQFVLFCLADSTGWRPRTPSTANILSAYWLGRGISDGPIDYYLNAALGVPYARSATPLLLVIGSSVGWGAAVLVLTSLRETLARCHVRPVQMLRVAAYAAPQVGIWWAIIVLTTVLLFSWHGPTSWLWYGFESDLILQIEFYLAALLAAVVPVWYMTAGLKYYLRLPQPMLPALAATIVGFLTPLTAFYVWAASKMGAW